MNLKIFSLRAVLRNLSGIAALQFGQRFLGNRRAKAVRLARVLRAFSNCAIACADRTGLVHNRSAS